MVSELALINVVDRHWAWLVLGWVTVCGQVNHLGHLGKLNLYLSRVGKSSTGLSGWGRGVFSYVGWQVTLCDRICMASDTP